VSINASSSINADAGADNGETASSSAPQPQPAPSRPLEPGDLINRELSWLEFNRRVLREAMDERTPLLERVRFLAIFTGNLDEFFQKRVGGLKRQVAEGVVQRTPDGMTPAQQLAAIRQTVIPMLGQQAECDRTVIRPALADHGIHVVRWDELTEPEKRFATRYFRENVFPVLTPLAVDPGHPFPFISNLSTSLGVTLRHPESAEHLFARVKIPEVLPSLIRLNRGEQGNGVYRFISLLELISRNLDDLFPAMVLLNIMPFRVTRNADIERDEEDVEDLLESIAQELRQRRFEKVVRLEHGPNPDSEMLDFLVSELELSRSDVYEMPGELDYGDLAPIADLPIPDGRYRPWIPVKPRAFADESADVFSVIRGGDVLVHHPYESFSASVERFVEAAATDPGVLAIKMTLYRTGDDSPFVRRLIEAAESGKQVVCLVELKARFDEERNIHWARALEKVGVHVVYGVLGLKTHTKTVLVVRREGEALRCYAHIGTGNYHVGTSRLYTDVGLFTADAAVTEELVELFHFLTGRSLKRDYVKLLVAPLNMRERFVGMIEREIEHRRAGRPCGIVAKMNSLEDLGICAALYRASGEGVPIDLIVRGFCCLRPGAPGLSENIRVISIVGRFLEHARLFHFRNGCGNPAEGEFYFGSADWMYRNLSNRVEAIVPVEEKALREKCWEILRVQLADERQAWDMRSDGTYVQRTPRDPTIDLGCHEQFMRLARHRAGESGAS